MTAPKMIESWFSLMTEAMKGSTDAQDAFRLLTGAATTQDGMMRWMTQFMPAAAATGLISPSQTRMFSEWVEEWWKVMGVVPRYRYLEALERNELLRRQLEDCEQSRKMNILTKPMSEQTEQAQQAAVNLWGTMVDETLKLQAEWMRNWAASQQPEEEPEKTQDQAAKEGQSESV